MKNNEYKNNKRIKIDLILIFLKINKLIKKHIKILKLRHLIEFFII